MKIFLSLLLLSSITWAASDLDKRPASFRYQGGLAVFTDFINADYDITYDLDKQTAIVEARIDFEMAESGNPIFDSLTDPTFISVDGSSASATLTKTPKNETVLRVINRALSSGRHKLVIRVPLMTMIEFGADGVKSAFWMSDLNDRSYLERYLPTNLIYDRIPMNLNVRFLGQNVRQRIYTNGELEEISDDEFRVTFSDKYNVTCPYFHTAPENSFAELAFNFRSIDGRDLPVLIYVPKEGSSQAEKLARIQGNVIRTMRELESDYGPFLHPSLTVYVGQATGGMEYAGATMTSERALGHEIFHSYFARGVMPSDGNAGWIDEALASWRDGGYQKQATLKGTSIMGNHGTYYRATDRDAYSFGAQLMAYFDYKTNDQGGLKSFLKELVAEKAFDPISVNDFLSSLNDYFRMDFTKDFDQYVFGVPKPVLVPFPFENSIHKQLSPSEMKSLL